MIPQRGAEMHDLQDIEVFALDAYGTLFDLSSPAQVVLEDDRQVQLLSERWRAIQLEIAWVESMTGVPPDFWSVTERALSLALARMPELSDSAQHRRILAARLLDAYATPDLRPGATELLTGLREAGFEVVAFSNATEAMLVHALSTAGLDDAFDFVHTADRFGVFKPDQRAYDSLHNRLRRSPRSICLVSSNSWDVQGAQYAGLSAVWIRGDQGGFPLRGPGASLQLDDFASLLRMVAGDPRERTEPW